MSRAHQTRGPERLSRLQGLVGRVDERPFRASARDLALRWAWAEALRGAVRLCGEAARVIGHSDSRRPLPLSVPDGSLQRYRLLVTSRRMQGRPSLPGGELIEKGLRELAEGVETVESLLVSIGAPRLRGLGFDVPPPFNDAEERLYLLLARQDAKGAHSRYNGLVRRLVSFERAAESAR